MSDTKLDLDALERLLAEAVAEGAPVFAIDVRDATTLISLARKGLAAHDGEYDRLLRKVVQQKEEEDRKLAAMTPTERADHIKVWAASSAEALTADGIAIDRDLERALAAPPEKPAAQEASDLRAGVERLKSEASVKEHGVRESALRAGSRGSEFEHGYWTGKADAFEAVVALLSSPAPSPAQPTPEKPAALDRTEVERIAREINDALSQRVARQTIEIADLRMVVRNAPHAFDCATRLYVCIAKSCTCWKREFADPMPSVEEFSATPSPAQPTPEKARVLAETVVSAWATAGDESEDWLRAAVQLAEEVLASPAPPTEEVRRQEELRTALRELREVQESGDVDEETGTALNVVEHRLLALLPPGEPWPTPARAALNGER